MSPDLDRSPKSRKPSPLRAAAAYASIGLMFPACSVGGYFLGSWLDKALATKPLFSYAGGLLGTVAGFVNLYRTVVAVEGRTKDE